MGGEGRGTISRKVALVGGVAMDGAFGAPSFRVFPFHLDISDERVGQSREEAPMIRGIVEGGLG